MAIKKKNFEITFPVYFQKPKGGKDYYSVSLSDPCAAESRMRGSKEGHRVEQR